MQDSPIPGYAYGDPALPRSPVSEEEFERLKQTVLFTDDDVRLLRSSLDLLAGRTDEILDVWYGFVASHPHLLASFGHARTGEPLAGYLDAVRQRFKQWILDTARAEYGQAWLDYQHEIGRRHHRTRKNVVDGVDAASIVPFRYLFLLAFPVTHTLRPFLAADGRSAEEVEGMVQAWMKSCLLQLTLWSYPYIREGDF